MHDSRTGGTQDAEKRFRQLRERYAASLGHKRCELERVWSAFVAAPDDAHARQELHTHVHRLSGSARAYGYEQLGSCAQAADHLLSEWLVFAEPLRDTPAALASRLAAPVRILLDALGATPPDAGADGRP